MGPSLVVTALPAALADFQPVPAIRAPYQVSEVQRPARLTDVPVGCPAPAPSTIVAEDDIAA